MSRPVLKYDPCSVETAGLFINEIFHSIHSSFTPIILVALFSEMGQICTCKD